MVTADALVDSLVADIVAYVPNLLGALVILALGWIGGYVASGLVRTVVDRSEFDRTLQRTRIGRMIGQTEHEISRTFGALARWFVYGIAFMAAADVLAIPLLSQWIASALAYLPAFVGGLAILVLGFVIADFVGDMIERTERATRSGYTEMIAEVVRVFLYIMVIIVALDTMRVDVGFIFLLAQPIAWGVAAAIAIGVGVAVGWGGKDYVADNIDRWMRKARDEDRSM